MNVNRVLLGTLLLSVTSASLAPAQTNPPASPAGAPPKLLLLVHQEFKFGKAGERQKLEVTMARAGDRFGAPNSWIDLQSITGPPEALFFDPLDSFEHLEKISAVWGRLFADHPELARTQEEIEALVSSERTLIAVRREDLGYRVDAMDISKARYMRVNIFRVHPGGESDFIEVAKIRAAAYEKANANTPWVVYQANAGTDGPTFLVFLTMRSLEELDALPLVGEAIQDAQGEPSTKRLEQIERESFSLAESQLYAVSPQMSHVSEEFAAGDPDFWSPKPKVAATPPSPKKEPAKPRTEKKQ